MKADPKYFEAFTRLMQRIEKAISDERADPVVICIAGGAAVHLYTGSRVSKDIDAKVFARFLLPDDLDISYRDAQGHVRSLYFDRQYNDTFSLLHENAYHDAVPIEVPGVDRRKLDVRLLAPLDLAVSKLSRYEANDQEDIAALASEGLVDSESLRARAEEALPGYVGNTSRVRGSLQLAIKLVKRKQAGNPPPARRELAKLFGKLDWDESFNPKQERSRKPPRLK